jgi:hypothetical protein
LKVILLLVVLGGIHSMASAASWFALQPRESVIDRIERTIHGLPASLPEMPPVVGVSQIITSILPGLLTAIAGGLLAVMTWLDNRGRRGEDPREFFAYPRANRGHIDYLPAERPRACAGNHEFDAPASAVRAPPTQLD